MDILIKKLDKKFFFPISKGLQKYFFEKKSQYFQLWKKLMHKNALNYVHLFSLTINRSSWRKFFFFVLHKELKTEENAKPSSSSSIMNVSLYVMQNYSTHKHIHRNWNCFSIFMDKFFFINYWIFFTSHYVCNLYWITFAHSNLTQKHITCTLKP